MWLLRKVGSKTGAINPNTNKEYESGTLEEFVLALENKKQYNVPDMSLFFRQQIAPQNVEESDQLTKVLKFKREQQNSGLNNEYINELERFVKANKNKHNNIKYIRYTIERMEEQFYMNKAQSYTLLQVKEKLKIIKQE